MYDAMKDVAIVSGATGFTFTTGRKYILVFHEFFYIPEMSHILINHNQISHFQKQVQDNPYATDPMRIIIPDGNVISFLD